MTPKKRLQETVKHKNTDIPAMYVWFSPEWEKRLASSLGVDILDLHPALGNDIVPVDLGINSYMMRDMPDGEESLSEFGFTYKKVGESFNIIKYPLKSAKDFVSYRHPDPDASGRYDILDRQVAKYGKEYPIMADISPVAFEAAYSLFGMEETMMALACEPEQLKYFFEKHINYTLAVARRCLDHGADIIWTGDDWGTQHGMLISPDMWRKEIKPMVARLWKGIKEHKPDAIIAHHSCGSISPIIPDLIEMGLDILNPIQPNVHGMEPVRLKRDFGDKLSFLGGIDTQCLLREGSPDEVKRTAEDTIKLFGTGYILSPAHRIHDVSFENIRAIFRAAKRETLEFIG